MDFTKELMLWFAQNKRDLPWRKHQDVYSVWLSEVILQQTRVAQGLDYWNRFLERWPTINLLAKASEDEVLKEWQGLGYYSRARNLHKAAKQVVEMGDFPNSYEGLKHLKGVGDYTAAAIASICFNEPVAVVDGNVYRVLSRYFGLETPIDSSEGKKQFKELAQYLIDKNNPSTYNQAIMDFGATQCTPKSPHCVDCPLIDSCCAYQNNRIDLLPVKRKKIKQQERRFTYIYLQYGHKIAIHQRGMGDIWQGLWEFPQDVHLEHSIGDNWKKEAISLKKNVKHVLTHQIIFADLYLLTAKKAPLLPKEFIWISPEQLKAYAIPRLIEILNSTIESINVEDI